jgi:DNA-binding transcriptional MerR regulator
MSYTTQTVQAITGINKQMLHYLCRTGLVTPTTSRKRGVKGHGVARKYSFGDLMICRVVQRLSASGVSPLKVKSAIRELHAMGMSLTRLPSSRVVMFGKSVYVWDRSADPFRAVDGQIAFAFILDLEAIHTELTAELQKLAA